MPINDFKPFATSVAANVIDQATYAAGVQLLNEGFQSGLARSDQFNKVWRQACFMAAVLAQYMADISGQDVLDDGDLLGKVSLLKRALNMDRLHFSNSPGSGNFVVADNVYRLHVKLWGAGGGGSGGGQGGAGGGGGSAERLCDVTPGQVIPMTVGAGGAGALFPAAGGNGGTTSFGTFCSAFGGQGGSSGGGTGGGATGNPPQSTLTLAGGGGDDLDGALRNGRGGSGAGGGGDGGFGQNATGATPGGGGGAAIDSGLVGGAGAPGLIIIRW